MTYPSGAVVTYFYDVTGQVQRVRLNRNGTFQPLAYNTQYAPFGPVTALTYGNGKTLAQTWDTAYRLSSQTTTGVLQLDYAQYDPNGNLRQRLDAIANQWSNFVYDPLDRLDTVSGVFGGRDYDYDPNSNRLRLVEGTAVTNYSYAQNTNRLALAGTTPVTLDANGNTTAQGARTYIYTSAFDHLTQALEGGAQIAAYAYNALGQRVSKQAGGVSTSYAYGLDGFLRVETASNTIPREYVYLHDQPLAVMDQTLVTGAGTALAVTTVPALKNSNISITWSDIASPTPADWVGIYAVGSNDFAYLDWAYTNGGASGTASVTLNHPGLVAGATYEARLYANDGYTLLAKSAPFVLNPAGPVVAVTSTQAVKGGSITVKWSGITTPATWDWVGIYAVGSDDYAYLDWAYTNGGSAGTVSVTLNHPSIVAGNTYEARLYANDGYTLIAKTPPFTVVGNTGQSTPAALYYVHNDHLGTPQALTDQAGAVVWRATYDPFGQATVNEDPDGDGIPVKNNKRYAGQYFDSETGLHYNWHRYYDPRVGRYISSDPIGLRGGLNTYLYAHANPLRYTDPFGLLTVNVWKYRGSRDAWGHVSITLDNGRHISWWPSADHQGLLKSLDIYSAPANPNQTYADDVRLEEQAPDYTIRIEGLDEVAIENWWDDFRQSHEWKTLSQNCSTTGADALKAGGAAKYANWWRLHNLIWTPNDVKALTESINRGLLEAK
jgi:RHS repeat-associated protein